MSRSTIFRRVSILFTSAVAATFVSSGLAAADPAANFGAGANALQAQAAAVSPAASAAVNHLIGAASLVPQDVLDLGITTPAPFMYPAPTLGCAIADNPATVTLATAQSGPNFPLPPWVDKGQLRFQALPGHIGIPETSGLSVAWFNLTTFQSGTVSLDEKLPVLDTPLLSKVVDTGEGTVLAAMFGTVDYVGGTTCTVIPTVGSFTA